MNFKKQSDLKDAGFTGFRSVRFLKDGGCSDLPEKKGVYMIIRTSMAVPHFLPIGTGGHYKDKDPNVPTSELQNNWIEGACVMYIGKATNLKKRISQYMSFGNGNNIGHYGGRYIWQLSDADQLLVAWKTTVEDPRDVESQLIQEFITQYSARPFANLRD